MALRERIGMAIRQIRQAQRISQVLLAEKLSVAAGETITQSYVSKVEMGHTNISWDRLDLFCKCMGCKPSQVVALTETLYQQEGEVMFVTIVCQCESEHEWQILLPKYYFSLKECRCPECQKPVVSMKAGELQTIEALMSGR